MKGIIPMFHNNDKKKGKNKYLQFYNTVKPYGLRVSKMPESCGCSWGLSVS